MPLLLNILKVSLQRTCQGIVIRHDDIKSLHSTEVEKHGKRIDFGRVEALLLYMMLVEQPELRHMCSNLVFRDNQFKKIKYSTEDPGGVQ